MVIPSDELVRNLILTSSQLHRNLILTSGQLHRNLILTSGQLHRNLILTSGHLHGVTLGHSNSVIFHLNQVYSEKLGVKRSPTVLLSDSSCPV